MIIGKGKIRIKKYDDFSIKCENCGSYEQRFLVYQDFFHFMLIPIVPLSNKTIKCFCKKCNDRFNHEKKEHYLSITKTPIYLYSGIVLFIGMIISIVILVSNNQKKEAEYIKNPMVGDVYLWRENTENSTVYYFLKISGINKDTVELLHGALQYYGTNPTMQDLDYFVKKEKFKVIKKDLINWKDSGYINSVERNYGMDSRYRIEK
jgi:hypothetical protein